jgi:uncharacterized phage protein gp47/JayE
MKLQLQNFTSLMQNMAAAVQGACTQLLDLTVGSALRAVLEANASLALWMQWLILQVLQATRAATSNGPDLDSWMADFSVVRLPAVAAQGTVTFARFTAGSTALITPGTLVRTLDGSQTFEVVTDTTNTAWSASLSGYVVPANSVSLDLPVAAQTAGSAGNVQAGAIGLLVSAIPGVDTVTNAASLQSGEDAESDTALRIRFQNFIDSRARATPVAIGYAVASVQQGLQYAIAQNTDVNGNSHMGNFVVTVDDGSGSPPSSLLSLVAQSVETMRPVGSTYAVLPPVVTQASVAMTITTLPATQKPLLLGPVQSAVESYINALPIGTTLPLSRLSQVAYGVDSAITNVSGVTINGATLDIAPGGFGVVKTSSVIIN